MSSSQALTIVAALSAVSIAAAGTANAQTRVSETRAVIELFTSQGCSSCPPADKILSELRGDPSLVALTLPIDYWDYLGWKDTLALPGHTARQKAYSQARGDREIYTPQVVINGVMQALGSDRAEIERAVEHSHLKVSPTVPVHVVVGDDRVTVTLAGVPAAPAGPAGAELASAVPGGEVWLCPLSRSITVGIGRGENHGRSLTYTNVVRRWVRLGTWNGKYESFTVPVDAIKGSGIDAIAVLLQSGNAVRPGAVLGASLASLR